MGKIYRDMNEVVNVPFLSCVCLAIAIFFHANRYTLMKKALHLRGARAPAPHICLLRKRSCAAKSRSRSRSRSRNRCRSRS